MKVIGYNKFVALFVFSVFFSCFISRAMGINKEIATLKDKRSQMLSTLEKKAGGNSTIAYRAMKKGMQEDFDKINARIEILEMLKSKL